MMWRQIFSFVQSAMLNILAHPWGVRIWAIAGEHGRSAISGHAQCGADLIRRLTAWHTCTVLGRPHAVHAQTSSVLMHIASVWCGFCCRAGGTGGRRNVIAGAAGPRWQGASQVVATLATDLPLWILPALSAPVLSTHAPEADRCLTASSIMSQITYHSRRITSIGSRSYAHSATCNFVNETGNLSKSTPCRTRKPSCCRWTCCRCRCATCASRRPTPASPPDTLSAVHPAPAAVAVRRAGRRFWVAVVRHLCPAALWAGRRWCGGCGSAAAEREHYNRWPVVLVRQASGGAVASKVGSSPASTSSFRSACLHGLSVCDCGCGSMIGPARLGTFDCRLRVGSLCWGRAAPEARVMCHEAVAVIILSISQHSEMLLKFVRLLGHASCGLRNSWTASACAFVALSLDVDRLQPVQAALRDDSFSMVCVQHIQ